MISTYVNRAASMFLFALGGSLAAMLPGPRSHFKVRWFLTWAIGMASGYVICILFHWIKDLILSAHTYASYFTTTEDFFYNCVLNFIVKAILTALIALCFRLADHTSGKRSLFLACAAVSAENIATLFYQMTITDYSSSFISIASTFSQSPANPLLYIGYHLLVYLIFWWRFIRPLSYEHIDNVSFPVLVTVLLITATAIFASCVPIPQTEDQYVSHLVLEITEFILCITILLLEYFIISWASSRFEQMQLVSLMQFQEKQYRLSQETMNVVNRNAHDMKYKLRVLMEGLRQDRSGLSE